uniref:Uncharacterized protein n=1 Tax=Rhizophora mucronata TaxID=61149 RepID=A0A2P2IU66_RHIMU
MLLLFQNTNNYSSLIVQKPASRKVKK